MRRIHLLVIIASLGLLSCSNDSPVGSDPSLPATPSPADQSAGQPSSLVLSWSGKGGDHFDVYLGTTSSPPLVAHDLTVTHYHPARLTGNSLYYWRVVNVGTDSNFGGPWGGFRTAEGTPPSALVQHAPSDGANVALDPAVLTWSPQPGDSLKFNVYFGSQPDPPLAVSDEVDTLYSAPVMAGNTYYWRVEAKNA